MLEQIDETYSKMPTRHLIDGGFTKNDDIERAHGANVTMYCPPTTNKHKTDPFEPRDDDGPGVAQWRERMKSEAGQAIYRLRAIHECINARFRQWRLTQLTVRGKAKAIVVHTWATVLDAATSLAAASSCSISSAASTNAPRSSLRPTSLSANGRPCSAIRK